MIFSVYLDVGLAVLVSLATITDLANRRIPNLLLLTGFCFSLLVNLLSPSPLTTILWMMFGATLGFFIFFPLYCLRGMAAGDIKLMAVVGTYINPIDILNVALVTVCLGGIMSLTVLVGNKWAGILPWQKKNKIRKNVDSIPYGVAIAGGAWFVILQQYHWITFLNLF